MIKVYEPIYTVKEVAKILKMNGSTVYALIKAGKLRCLKLGQLKIRGTDLERFIESYPSELADTVEDNREGETNDND